MATFEQTELTGYPSIDKPWLHHYPLNMIQRKEYTTIYQCLKNMWTDGKETIVNYYGNDISVTDFFNNIQATYHSLCALGVCKKDSILASLESTPEFIYLFLACELLGCTLKTYIGSADEISKIICDGNIHFYFAPSYLAQQDSDKIYTATQIRKIIIVDPLFSANNDAIRENIRKSIDARFTEEASHDPRNLAWDNFIRLGLEGSRVVHPNSDAKRRLLCAFTSGTTGVPKEVMHSSESLMGVINQLALFPSHEKEKDTWLLTILPPTLVAIVVAMIFYPLADGKKLILDPYCDLEDIDIEMMHYEPQCWGLVPIFFDTLLNSNRIPPDYDMSYFKLFGFGAEPMSTKFIGRVQSFLESHNCVAPFSSGYGQSEGGSDFTVAIGKEMMSIGTAGIPLIDTTISIFEPGTCTELKYNQVGEICKAGPGLMIGYSEKGLTETVLLSHPDGKKWLHTGDYGFMTEHGLLFVLGREIINIFPDKYIFGQPIEEKALTVEGVQEAIVVSGVDREHLGYKVPYLFLILEKGVNAEKAVNEVRCTLNQELSRDEKPRDIYVIDEKPIRKFKIDRRNLQTVFSLD